MVDEIFFESKIFASEVAEVFPQKLHESDFINLSSFTQLIVFRETAAFLLELQAVRALFTATKDCVPNLPFGRLWGKKCRSGSGLQMMRVLVAFEENVCWAKLRVINLGNICLISFWLS